MKGIGLFLAGLLITQPAIVERPVRRSNPGFVDFGNNIRMGMRAAGCRNLLESDYEQTAKILSVVARRSQQPTRVLYVGNRRLGYAAGIVDQVLFGLSRGEQVILVYCTNARTRGIQGPDPIQLLRNRDVTDDVIAYVGEGIIIFRMSR